MPVGVDSTSLLMIVSVTFLGSTLPQSLVLTGDDEAVSNARVRVT